MYSGYQEFCEMVPEYNDKQQDDEDQQVNDHSAGGQFFSSRVKIYHGPLCCRVAWNRE
jgi:hypothetical protein